MQKKKGESDMHHLHDYVHSSTQGIAVAAPLYPDQACLDLHATFSPLALAGIPGLKLAGMTYWYEAYYEVWLGGQYFKRVAQMHQEYAFIDEVYPGAARKTNKPLWFRERTGTPYSMVSTPDHDLHRQRRSVVNAFFSVASIRRLEPIMKNSLSKMFKHIDNASENGNIVQMHRLFKACASDVITQYAFGDSLNFLDQSDCGKPYFDATDWFFYLTHVFGLFPGLVAQAQTCPAWIIRIIAPFLSALRDRQDWWIDKVRDIRNSKDRDRVKKSIFDGILNSSVPESEKSDKRLASEAQLIVFAGEGTTAHSLTCCLFHLLDRPSEVDKLKAELAKAISDPDNISIAQVDNLPYLDAIILEAVRLHPGVMARQVRISPEVPIVYLNPKTNKRYVVPPDTVTSMSPLDIHMHPDAFGDDAYEFRPQRWIDNPKLRSYFIGFSRGTRNCLGMTLAHREMAITLASIFTKYDVYRGQAGPTLELYDTTRKRDIDADSDYIIPVPTRGSKGLRVKIRS
nr:trichodiene oxygenase [Quercus suber]